MVNVLEAFQVVPSSLGSGIPHGSTVCYTIAYGRVLPYVIYYVLYIVFCIPKHLKLSAPRARQDCEGAKSKGCKDLLGPLAGKVKGEDIDQVPETLRSLHPAP